MKSNLPPELEANIPKTSWGRVLSATPIVMTVVATLLAGLASSEMTRAQYDRSLATQQQSKAGDQWSFFQAKRLRAVIQQGTLDGLEFSAAAAPRQGEALSTALRSFLGSDGANTLADPELEALASGRVPEVAPAQFDPTLQLALAAVAAQRTELETTPLIAAVSSTALAAGILEAKAAVIRLDEMLRPVLQGIEALPRKMSEVDRSAAHAGKPGTAVPVGLKEDVVTARIRFTIHRYEAEARLNQTLANLYEIEVRKSNASADHHYARSQRFFYGMLAAQLSVIMSTFATAVRMRTALWTMAAVAGLFAVALAAYVYLVG